MKHLAIAALAAAAFAAASFATAGIAFADPPAHARAGGNNPHAEGRHDNGLHRGWDRRRFNGYTYRGVWHYGPPPADIVDLVELGYRAWRRGERLPEYYRDSLAVVDYRVYELAPPPRGYHYVRDDRGDYLLVGIATGIILGVILASD
jgi:Ni/Co efflux regulator RcnB